MDFLNRGPGPPHLFLLLRGSFGLQSFCALGSPPSPVRAASADVKEKTEGEYKQNAGLAAAAREVSTEIEGIEYCKQLTPSHLVFGCGAHNQCLLRTGSARHQATHSRDLDATSVSGSKV